MAQRKYSHSMLSLYRACALKFRLRYEDRLVPTQPASRHDADYGNAWDAGLNTLYAKDGSVKKAQEAFAATYPQATYPSVLPMRSQGKTFSNGLAALKSYAARWREEDAHWTVLSIQDRDKDAEVDKILKLDLVVQDDRDGQVYGIDSKTTGGYLDNNYWMRFDPDSQVRFYTDHIKSKYGHCGGFYINAASFKHRSKAYTPRSGPDKGIQQPAGDWHSFARMVFNPNEDCLQLERDNFAYWVGRIEADRLSGTWGYNTQSCHMYGQECEYFKLCSAGYSWPRDEELILNHYRQMCPRVLDAGRCQLDLDHEGECDATPAQPANDYDVQLEDNEVIEDAVS